ncbi:hypothetical protein [Cellulomonas endometrii]|uniref:hypothetical protein n=1 Tax=Cellulomonas endometrii TaxID=3036301 RepID=UPI0024AC9EEB|nr:hypothetical protein [Cellulomonas endometrii]
MADDGPDAAPFGAADQEPERTREERTAARRQLLDVQPGNIRDPDPDAAAACECSCHPRPGQPDKHGSDLCSCQWTGTDRAAHLVEGNRVIEQQRPEMEAARLESMRDLKAAAAELDIEATEEVPGAPWVIAGRVDGRRYYLRDRGGTYTVVVAPAGQPDLDPWRAPAGARLVVARSGDSADLFTGRWVNHRRALRVVAAAVRTQLRREKCTHPHHDADRFCPACGVPLRDEVTPVRTGLDDYELPNGGDGWRTGRHLRVVGVAHRAWQDADDRLRGAVQRARAAGDPWWLISLMLHVDEQEAVRWFGDEPA